MTPTETAAILRQFNEWRRGDEDIPQFDPRQIGGAIEAAVEMIERLEAAEKERDALRAKIAEMEKQEPVGKIVAFGESLHEPSWRGGRLPPLMTDLYALPGAQPAPSVPEDVKRDAERYRYLRARDDGTAGVGCWVEADGRVCDRGWLYGVQLDSAIDTCIEMLAAAPEAKP